MASRARSVSGIVTASAVLWGVLFAVGSPATAQVRDVSIAAERTIGYVIGDRIRHRIEIVADGRWTVAPATLPRAGRIAYWLDLIAIESRAESVGGRTVLWIDAEYQTFYAPLEARQLTVPGFQVGLVASGGETAGAAVPEWRFTMSPLRAITSGGVSNTSGGIELLPAREPVQVSTTNASLRLAGSGALAFGAALLIARHHAVFPFARRRGRPFAKARRVIAKTGPEGYLEGLVALHRAFDETAGRRLFVEDLDEFLEAAPQFAAEREAIADFFAASAKAFYDDRPDDARTVLPAAGLGVLAGRLAGAERAGR